MFVDRMDVSVRYLCHSDCAQQLNFDWSCKQTSGPGYRCPFSELGCLGSWTWTVLEERSSTWIIYTQGQSEADNQCCYYKKNHRMLVDCIINRISSSHSMESGFMVLRTAGCTCAYQYSTGTRLRIHFAPFLAINAEMGPRKARHNFLNLSYYRYSNEV